jgi:hypothetical protein
VLRGDKEYEGEISEDIEKSGLVREGMPTYDINQLDEYQQRQETIDVTELAEDLKFMIIQITPKSM